MRCAINGKGSADVSHYFELLVSWRSSSPLDDSSSKKMVDLIVEETQQFLRMTQHPGIAAISPRANGRPLDGTGTAMLRRCHMDVTFGGEKAHP
jgi:hypothetical protein